MARAAAVWAAEATRETLGGAARLELVAAWRAARHYARPGQTLRLRPRRAPWRLAHGPAGSVEAAEGRGADRARDLALLQLGADARALEPLLSDASRHRVDESITFSSCVCTS